MFCVFVRSLRRSNVFLVTPWAEGGQYVFCVADFAGAWCVGLASTFSATTTTCCPLPFSLPFSHVQGLPAVSSPVAQHRPSNSSPITHRTETIAPMQPAPLTNDNNSNITTPTTANKQQQKRNSKQGANMKQHNYTQHPQQHRSNSRQTAITISNKHATSTATQTSTLAEHHQHQPQHHTHQQQD